MCSLRNEGDSGAFEADVFGDTAKLVESDEEAGVNGSSPRCALQARVYALRIHGVLRVPLAE